MRVFSMQFRVALVTAVLFAAGSQASAQEATIYSTGSYFQNFYGSDAYNNSVGTYYSPGQPTLKIVNPIPVGAMSSFSLKNAENAANPDGPVVIQMSEFMANGGRMVSRASGLVNQLFQQVIGEIPGSAGAYSERYASAANAVWKNESRSAQVTKQKGPASNAVREILGSPEVQARTAAAINEIRGKFIEALSREPRADELSAFLDSIMNRTGYQNMQNYVNQRAPIEAAERAEIERQQNALRAIQVSSVGTLPLSSSPAAANQYLKFVQNSMGIPVLSPWGQVLGMGSISNGIATVTHWRSDVNTAYAQKAMAMGRVAIGTTSAGSPVIRILPGR